ncbi:MAG: hypothetical protein FD129_2818, partial [bacterium]
MAGRMGTPERTSRNDRLDSAWIELCQSWLTQLVPERVGFRWTRTTAGIGYSWGMIIDKPLRSLLWLLALVGATEPAGAVDIIGRVDISRPIATRATPIATRATPTATRNPATASLDTLAARIFLRGPEMVTTRRSGPITIRRDIRNGVLVPSFE